MCLFTKWSSKEVSGCFPTLKVLFCNGLVLSNLLIPAAPFRFWLQPINCLWLLSPKRPTCTGYLSDILNSDHNNKWSPTFSTFLSKLLFPFSKHRPLDDLIYLASPFFHPFFFYKCKNFFFALHANTTYVLEAFNIVQKPSKDSRKCPVLTWCSKRRNSAFMTS